MAFNRGSLHEFVRLAVEALGRYKLRTTLSVLGVVLGCAFAVWIDPIFSFVNYVAGGGVWDPSIRGIYALPTTERPWGGQAIVIETSLFNVEIVSLGALDIVLAGTVTVAELDRIAGEVVARGGLL